MIRFFLRRLGEHMLRFTYRDGQIIDTETQSVWSVDGQAEWGTLAGTQLRKLVGIPAFWFAWLVFHPQTELYK
jgi:hypothetical protein